MEEPFKRDDKNIFVVVGAKVVGPCGNDSLCAIKLESDSQQIVNQLSHGQLGQDNNVNSIAAGIMESGGEEESFSIPSAEAGKDLNPDSESDAGPAMSETQVTADQILRLPAFTTVVQDRPITDGTDELPQVFNDSVAAIVRNNTSDEDLSGFAIQFLAQRAAQHALLAHQIRATSLPSPEGQRQEESPIYTVGTPSLSALSPGKKRQRLATSVGEEAAPSPLAGQRKQRSNTHTGIRSCVCEICHAVLSAPASLKTHMLIHSGDKPYSCVMCSASFRHQSTLKRHMCIHTGEKKFACDICHSLFARKTELTQHQRSHSTARPFICKICGSSYKHPKDLSQHLRAHARSSLYPCKDCSSSFEGPASPKEGHAEVQKDSESDNVGVTVSCQYCEMTFANLTALTQHMMQNHLANTVTSSVDSDPSTVNDCALCGMKFDDLNSLVLHKKQCHWTEQLDPGSNNSDDKSPEHSCKICSIQFTSSCALAQHIKKKHWFSSSEAESSQELEDSHSCSICGMEYPRLKSLAQHMKKSHSINLLPCAKCGNTFVAIQEWLEHINACSKVTAEEELAV